MLAFGLLLILAAEAAGLGLIAWDLASGNPAIAILVHLGLLVATWVGYGLVSTLVTYALASWSVPRSRATLAPPIGVVVRETLAMAVLFALLQPFERLLNPSEARPARGLTRPRVLFIHGYFCNRGLWWYHRMGLEAAGYSCSAINLEPPWDGIDAFARQVQQRIEAMRAQTPAAPIVLVAHSMGGLAARAALARPDCAGVAKLITLGTPHHGTMLGHWGIGTCARQMQPGSPWLRKLAQEERRAVPLVSVWSEHDNYMAPVDTPLLAGSRTIAMPRHGHLSFALSPSVRRLLVQEVAAVAGGTS